MLSPAQLRCFGFWFPVPAAAVACSCLGYNLFWVLFVFCSSGSVFCRVTAELLHCFSSARPHFGAFARLSLRPVWSAVLFLLCFLPPLCLVLFLFARSVFAGEIARALCPAGHAVAALLISFVSVPPLSYFFQKIGTTGNFALVLSKVKNFLFFLLFFCCIWVFEKQKRGRRGGWLWDGLVWLCFAVLERVLAWLRFGAALPALFSCCSCFGSLLPCCSLDRLLLAVFFTLYIGTLFIFLFYLNFFSNLSFTTEL